MDEELDKKAAEQRRSSIKQGDSKCLVSIVIPCYYSQNTIAKVVEQTINELEGTEYAVEFVLVNDGSRDGTFQEIEKLVEAHSNVIGLNLSNNFGQHSAILAGLHYVNGDLILLMDDDMQTHPSQCIKLLSAMNDGWDVVFAEWEVHKEAWWRRLGSCFSNWTMRVFTEQPRNITESNFLVMQRYVADEVCKYDGSYIYIQGLIFRITQNIANVRIQHFDREEGRSGYTLKSLIGLWSSIFNFSLWPLRFAAVFGFFCGALGILGAIMIVVQKMTVPDIDIGWSSIMVAIFTCFGLTIGFLGLLGEYVGRIFLSIGKKPQYVVKTEIKSDRRFDS